jgi:acyl-CoA synthetase (NDP forming)
MDDSAQLRGETRQLIRRLFAPYTVAIVGAGINPKSMGGRALAVLRDRSFAGEIYPVNPNREEIAGLRCYPSLSAIPGRVDVVELLISPEATVSTIEEAASCGAYAIVLLNAGFAEMGPAGEALQREVSRVAAEKGIRLIGPNCGGIMNVRRDIPLGFLPAFSLVDYPVGTTGIVSQSGGVLTNLLNKVHDRRIGLSYAASTGNESDMTWLDFLDFLVHDDSTTAIAVYAEGMPDGARFIAVAKEALIAGKPIVMLKGGSSVAGEKAAASHTAALATSQRILEAVAGRFGITLVDDVDDLIDVASYLGSRDQSKGAPVVAVCTSGGLGVMTADAMDDFGVPMAQLSDATVTRLEAALPKFANVGNPVDMTSQYLNDPTLFRRTIAALAEAPEIGAIFFSLAMITGGYAEQFADDIVEIRQVIHTPITISWIGGSVAAGGVARLRDAGISVFSRLRTAGLALRSSSNFAQALLRTGVNTEPDQLATTASGLTIPEGGFTEFEAETLLSDLGIPIARGGLARTADEAVRVADEFGYPVVLKVSSRLARHKTDVGGVRTRVLTPAAVRASFQELQSVAVTMGERSAEVLVQETAPSGLEMIVGLQRDPQYGWMVLVGRGGIAAEVDEDVSIRPAPVNDREAREMVRSLRGARLLEGIRGGPELDTAALVDLLVRVSTLSRFLGDQDLDVELNPVFVLEQGRGCCCVDALITPSGSARTTGTPAKAGTS